MLSMWLPSSEILTVGKKAQPLRLGLFICIGTFRNLVEIQSGFERAVSIEMDTRGLPPFVQNRTNDGAPKVLLICELSRCSGWPL